jgi:hypothetical protein
MAISYTTTSSGRSLNQLEITGWVIEYWNPVTCRTSCFSSLDGSWRQAPSENVIYVWFYLGEYITGLKGNDYYFFDEEKGIFGCYQSPVLSETSHDGPSSYYYIENNEQVRVRTPAHTRPDVAKDEDIKGSIWVVEPYATEIGIICDSKKHHITAKLRRYT